MNYGQMGKKSDFNVLVQKLKIQLLEGRADARALKKFRHKRKFTRFLQFGNY